MSFTKFMAFLEKRALYFARADKLADEDPYEGHLTHVNARVLSWYMASPEFWATLGFNSREQFEGFLRARSFHRRALQEMRQLHFINCWHLGDDESDAMWKLYCGVHEGVCIQSTFGSLVESLKNIEEPVYIGKVRYIDYRREVINEGDGFAPYIHKRRAFQHENELRAMLWRFNETDYGYFHADGSKATKENYTYSQILNKFPQRMGIDVPLDIPALVKAVYVSPTSPAWFNELVASAIERYGFRLKLEQSALSELPPE